MCPAPPEQGWDVPLETDFVCPFTCVASSSTSGPYRKAELLVDILEDTISSDSYGEVGTPREIIKHDIRSRLEERFPSSGVASDDSSADAPSSEEDAPPFDTFGHLVATEEKIVRPQTPPTRGHPAIVTAVEACCECAPSS